MIIRSFWPLSLDHLAIRFHSIYNCNGVATPQMEPDITCKFCSTED